jgi:putative nucleotidyltransferase with HDIG domain
MRNYLLPPQSISFEQQQKARYLHVALLSTSIACLLIAIFNISAEAFTFINLLLIIAAFCIAAVILNHHGYYTLAALMLNSLLWIASIFNLYDGAGLSDPGIVVFPILIVLSGFLFRRWAVVFTAVLSSATVWGLYWGHVQGWFELGNMPSSNRASILTILYILSAVLYWTISDNWERTLRALRESYDLTLEGWGRALELRDFETKGHSDRVERLCVGLAEKLGCTPEEIRHIRRGAYLHDIGKIAIRDDVLFKTDKLSDEDWVQMKRHPEMGRQMIAHIPFLASTHGIIYSHHERWDGKGYPDGLKGEAIPLWARIFTLIDHWDALNSDRPYRDAWPREKIIAYFKENAGIIFDPDIVPVFLELLETEGQTR